MTMSATEDAAIRTEEFAQQLHYFNEMMAEMRPAIGLDTEDLISCMAAQQFLDSALNDYTAAHKMVTEIEAQLAAARADLERTDLARQAAEQTAKTVIRESIAALAARPGIHAEYLRNLRTALDLTEPLAEADTTTPATPSENKASFLRRFFTLETEANNQPYRFFTLSGKVEDTKEQPQSGRLFGDLFGRPQHHSAN